MRRAVDAALRVVLTSMHVALRAFWFVRRPRTLGAHALAVTPEGKLVLVRLRYAPGWRVPGGGRSANEHPADAVLRELREEIGMTSHGEVQPAGDFDEPVHFKQDSSALLIVRDVRYRPRCSWEVERICEADPDSLPADISPTSRRWIQEFRALL